LGNDLPVFENDINPKDPFVSLNSFLAVTEDARSYTADFSRLKMYGLSNDVLIHPSAGILWVRYPGSPSPYSLHLPACRQWL